MDAYNVLEWLQQRSALTFVHDALNRFKDLHGDRFGDLPYVRAIRIIQSDFFQELLAAEERGTATDGRMSTIREHSS